MTKIVEPVENGEVDMAIGSRYVADSEYTPSLSRRIGKSLLSRIVDSVCGGGITDTTSGFRAANRAVIERILNACRLPAHPPQRAPPEPAERPNQFELEFP